MSKIDSKELSSTDTRIGQKKICPLWINKMRYSTDVERSVTAMVVSVSPRHLPIMISSCEIGFGKIR